MTVRGVKRAEVLRLACRDHSIELARPRLCSAVDVGELMWEWLTAAAAGFVEIGGSRPGGRRACRGRARLGGPAHGRCWTPGPGSLLSFCRLAGLGGNDHGGFVPNSGNKCSKN